MADESDILFQEVEDDLRQDKANKLWSTYGMYIVGIAVAAVVGVASFQGWKSYDLSSRQAAGETFAAAQKLIEEQRSEEALQAFSDISNESGGYAILARFRVAALHSSGGDLSAAIATYKTLADDSSLTPYYQDMAVILGAFVELDSNDSGVQLIEKVGTLTGETNPWRHSAREILGLSALQSGDIGKASEYFQAITDDATAPQTIKTRTSEMLTILGG